MKQPHPPWRLWHRLQDDTYTWATGAPGIKFEDVTDELEHRRRAKAAGISMPFEAHHPSLDDEVIAREQLTPIEIAVAQLFVEVIDQGHPGRRYIWLRDSRKAVETLKRLGVKLEIEDPFA